MSLVRDLTLPEDIRGSNTNSNSNTKNRLTTSSQCSHAAAISSNAYGFSPSPDCCVSNHDDKNSISISVNSWAQWNTALESNIASIKSTENGSIIAASTTNGSVSLLRGSDGGILLNKSISSETNSNSDCNSNDCDSFSHRIGFVQNTRRYDSNDMLIIYNLDRSTKDANVNANANANVRTSSRSMDMIVVSNIDGTGLNSNDATVVKACSKFSIDGITLAQRGSDADIDTDADVDTFQVLHACMISDRMIRFILGHANGTVSVHDYNTVEKKLNLVNKCFIEGVVNVEKGIHIDASNTNNTFVIVAIKKDSNVVLCWYDLHSLECVGECAIPLDVTCTSHVEVTALCSLKPCLENTVAVAVSMEHSNANVKIVILQGVLNNSNRSSMGMDTFDAPRVERRVSKVHQVYSINLEPGSSIDSLVDCSSTHNASGEYILRYSTRSSDSMISFKEFRSGKSIVIAQVRLLLAQNRIEDAEEAISNAAKESLSTQHGSIHSSEVVMARFLVLLNNPKMLTGESKDQVKECLRRLSFGAVSEGPHGVRSLVLASRALYQWKSGDDTSPLATAPAIRDYRLALSVMAMSISNALKGVSSKYVDILNEEMSMLEAKASVLKTIESILDGPSGKPKVQLYPPLINVNGHDELYQLLIERGAFRVAENVRKSETGMKTITAKVLAESVQRISVEIDPKRYCPWLKNVVFPGLAMERQLLDLVLSWGCETADAFDVDGSFGIGASIFLLETIESAVNKMNVDSHGSFASYSPFNRSAISNITLPMQIDINLSMGSNNSGLDNSSQNKIDDVSETYQFSYKTKLMHARIIKNARDIGLPPMSLQLSRFEIDGGSNFAAKELVRFFFTNSWSDYLSDNSEEKKKVQKFCEFAQVKFDTAIQIFSKELCTQGSANPVILSRANDLVESCSNPDVRCEITLRFLRTAQVAATKPPSLKGLAQEALSWATSEEILSELEEATRLLGIDEILRKYCGNKSAEVFRVADPVHSIRLVEFVTRKVNSPSALADVLYLCSAFTHLSPLQHCSTFIERLVTSLPTSEVSRCGTSLQSIYEVDAKLGESVAVRVCNFCANIISTTNGGMLGKTEYDVRDSQESVFMAAIEICRSATRLSPMATILKLQKDLAPSNGINLWNELMHEFQRLLDLQRDFNVNVTLWQLRERSNHDMLMNAMITDAVDSSEFNSDRLCSALKLNLGKSRRGCALLFGSDEAGVITSRWCKAIGHVACKLVTSGKEDLGILLLETSGVLDEIHNATAYQAIVVVVLSLCSKASLYATCKTANSDDDQRRSMMNIILANSLLQDHALVFCPGSLVPLMVFLSNLVDVATQMILRSDSGVGEEMQASKQRLFNKSRKRQQPLLFLDTSPRYANVVDMSLHKSWHTGDGLLLPPREAMVECMTYCKELLSPLAGKNPSNLTGIHTFLRDRGVHSISLRLLINGAVVTSSNEDCSTSLFNDQAEILNDTILKLSERCLGGSGTGNTSGNIDHQLAVPLLLSLHMKVAFKTFKRCLPSALSRRDFDRVNALANVGLRAAGTPSPFQVESIQKPLGWNNQTNFVLQCNALAQKAFWWGVLQSLGVRFDPSSFDVDQEAAKQSGTEYIKSLLPDFIRCASDAISNGTTVQLLACNFCKAFNVESKTATQEHIAFLLSMPTDISTLQPVDSLVRTKSEIRNDLVSCAAAVRLLLDTMPNNVCRSVILRKCLVSFEKFDSNGKEFDRYNMLLSLYQSELRGMLSMQSEVNSVQSMCLHQEIERIDRRQDALAILSSFYCDTEVEYRPCVQQCFTALPKVLEVENAILEKKYVGILGERGKYRKDFDPIRPLIQCLKSDSSLSVISALAPICISLGVPSGSIHARALIERMAAAKVLGGSLPPFDAEVLPVLKRLKVANDGAELAEWCASQYPSHSQDRLLCLETGLDLAMKASTRSEQIVLASRKNDRKELLDDEKAALDRVERMTHAKSALSDILTVKRVLEKSMEGVKDAATNSIVSVLIEKSRTAPRSEEEISPEQFAENLLIECSLASAQAVLDEFISLSMARFRQIASAVHSACKALEDQYSHIDVGRISRSLVRRWLLHGDECQIQVADKIVLLEGRTNDKHSVDESLDCSMDDDDTMDLVLDLNIAAGQSVWDDVGDEPKLKRLNTITADEEHSSIKATTSREMSEYLCARAALRVSFVMSFAEGFHSLHDTENFDPNLTRENLGFGIEENARKHAKYLLKLVFSQSGFEKQKNDSSVDGGETMRSGLGNTSANTKKMVKLDGKALTFAMRHRALRAASTLCPENIVYEIIAEEGFLKGRDCTLSMCCFGVFVAKEIEAMSLVLPHSDLIQLSMMHKPSYARTLWRHHGKSTNQGHKSRVMLLMLELALKDRTIIDYELTASILQEIIGQNLPRTNLLVCECMSHAILPKEGAIRSLVMKVMKNLTASVLHDFSIQNDDNKQDGISTIQRLGSLIVTFMCNEVSQKEIEHLVNSLTHLAIACQDKALQFKILEVVASIIRGGRNNGVVQDQMFQRLRSSISNDEICSHIAIAIGVSKSSGSETFSSRDCLGQIMKMEYLFDRNLSQVLFPST